MLCWKIILNIICKRKQLFADVGEIVSKYGYEEDKEIWIQKQSL